MLPVAAPLTDDDADAWLNAGIPRWVTRHVPAALWLVAFIVSVATDNTQCTPADPGVCGPDYGFAWFVVVAIATPILFFWMPLLACAAGMAFALADLRYDPADLSRGVYAAHGLVCLVVALLLLRARRAQRQVVASRGVTTRISAPQLHLGSSVLRAGVVVLLLPTAAASLWWYHRLSAAESRHLSRTELVTARVVATSSDDSTITIHVDQALANPRKIVVDVLDTHAYRLGGTTPVLLDPQDGNWKRLVAEPYDPTGWESLGIGALALLALFAGRELQRRRAIRLIASTAQPCLQVRMSRPAPETVLFTTESDTKSFGELLVVEPHPPEDHDDPDGVDAEGAANFGELWRSEHARDDLPWHGKEELIDVPAAAAGTIEPAVLVGALYDGGWAVLVTADRVLAPRRPLRLDSPSGGSFNDLLAKAPRRFRRAPQPTDDDALPGVPIESGDEVATLGLPSVAHPLSRARQLGRLWMLASFGAVPFVVWLTESWYQRGLVVLLGGQLLLAGSRRSGQQLGLAHDHLEIVGPWNTLQVPWERLHGARRDGAVLLLAWEPDFVIALGPLELVGSSQTPEVVAQTLGATAVRLRARALAVGHPNRHVRRVPGAARAVLVAYGLVTAATLWLVASGRG